MNTFDMYPSNFKPSKEVPLQSYLFGHRIQAAQTQYEYLIEFLQVIYAQKKDKRLDKNYDNDMFPIDATLETSMFSYYPKVRNGLKRFIFFPKGKMESKAKIDKEAYAECKKVIKKAILDASDRERENHILIIQNLMMGFSADYQNRSWFDQNMLPICEEVILPEAMGEKKLREGVTFQTGNKDIDNAFEYKKYTYMCRGGEVYYLHLLNALNEFPELKTQIVDGIQKMTHSFPEFSYLCRFIENNWNYHMKFDESSEGLLEKELGAIPTAFSSSNKYTLDELVNLFSSKTHPFEKMEIFSDGMILQLLRLMYRVSANDFRNCWVIDVNLKSNQNLEVKKIAAQAFKWNEDAINNYLYKGFEKYKNLREERNNPIPINKYNKTIKDAIDDSYKLFRKLGKNLGIIIPVTGKNMRFTLSENIIKFLVLSLIPPKGMVTLDEFIELLYKHYGIVIGENEYKIEMERGTVPKIGDCTCFKANKQAFSLKLKECGFLRDLSDATSIVENPFEREDYNV